MWRDVGHPHVLHAERLNARRVGVREETSRRRRRCARRGREGGGYDFFETSGGGTIERIVIGSSPASGTVVNAATLGQ